MHFQPRFENILSFQRQLKITKYHNATTMDVPRILNLAALLSLWPPIFCAMQLYIPASAFSELRIRRLPSSWMWNRLPVKTNVPFFFHWTLGSGSPRGGRQSNITSSPTTRLVLSGCSRNSSRITEMTNCKQDLVFNSFWNGNYVPKWNSLMV